MEPDQYGDLVETETTTYEDIPCMVASSSARGEVRRADDTIVERVWSIILDGDYQLTADGYKVIVGGDTYNLIRAERSSVRKLTRLECERIT